MPRIANQAPSRLRLLWTILRWEGALRNSRVRQVFGLQRMQAHRLISDFVFRFPTALIWDERDLQWQVGDEKAAIREAGTLEEFLSACVATGIETPVFDARIDFLAPSPSLLALLSKAAQSQCAVALHYRSMSAPQGRYRVIYPRALVRLSPRWHVRAWCPERGAYRDFNIGRMSKVKLITDRIPTDAGEDLEWSRIVQVRICVHGDLPAPAHEMVRSEYFGGAVSMRVPIRGALVHYTLQAARVATDPKSQTPPDYLLTVANPEEIQAFLFRKSVD